ncbi:MAG TPA: hypothetical protein VME69_03210 [Methylocella sp.]|nr:hypothetical protein [Methylocella sp.]
MSTNGSEQRILFPTVAAPIVDLWRTTVIDLPTSIARETLSFASHRVQSQRDYLARAPRCATISDVIDLNSRFMLQAVNDYGTEVERFMENVQQKWEPLIHSPSSSLAE